MNTIEWGWLIVVYLFLGGLSAGLYFMAALSTLLQTASEHGYTRIARLGAMLAPWPVALGCLVLVFDLGRWYTFYKLFLHFRWTSPMSIGAWLLGLFSAFSLLFLYAWLTQEQRRALFARLPAVLSRLDRDLSAWRRPLALAGIPLSLGVGIYTGILLGAVQARPFWNTNLVAQLFLVSALSSGTAALILMLATRSDPQEHELRLLYTADVLLLAIEFFIVLPFLVHGQLSSMAVRQSLDLILGGPFTILFWVFFLALGLMLPLAVETYEVLSARAGRRVLHAHRATALAVGVLVLSGGLMLRFVFVYAGQMSAIPG